MAGMRRGASSVRHEGTSSPGPKHCTPTAHTTIRYQPGSVQGCNFGGVIRACVGNARRVSWDNQQKQTHVQTQAESLGDTNGSTLKSGLAWGQIRRTNRREDSAVSDGFGPKSRSFAAVHVTSGSGGRRSWVRSIGADGEKWANISLF